MNPALYPALAQEIASDPMRLGLAEYLPGRAAFPIAALLSQLHGEWTKCVPFVTMPAVLGWAARGVLDQVTAGSTNANLTSEARSICQVALRMFNVGPYLYLRQPQLSAAPAAGGSLTPWTYYYVLVGLTANGDACKSLEASATVAGTNQSVALSWPAYCNEVVSWQIYRGGASGQENLLLTTINDPTVTSWTDNGSVGGVAATQPTCHADLVGALAQAGVITSAQYQQALALRWVAPAARTEVLFGAGVFADASAVRQALGW